MINMSKDQSINLEIDLAHFKSVSDILDGIVEELESMDFRVIEGLGEDDEILTHCTHWWEIAKGNFDFMASIHNSIQIAQNDKLESQLIISMTFQLVLVSLIGFLKAIGAEIPPNICLQILQVTQRVKECFMI